MSNDQNDHFHNCPRCYNYPGLITIADMPGLYFRAKGADGGWRTLHLIPLLADTASMSTLRT
jgi:hypothetical protein